MKDDVWYGKNGAQLKCPVPDCAHIGSIITKAHCRVAHDMERDKLGKLYGAPRSVKKGAGWDIVRG